MNNSGNPLFSRLGLISQTTRWRLTAKAWLIVGLFSIALGISVGRWIYPFLAITDRLQSKVLVVEGWLPDYSTIDPVIDEFLRGHYEIIVVTGGPTPRREFMGKFKTYPELTKAILEGRGINPETVIAVPCGGVVKDRTYASALALKQWLANRTLPIKSFNLLTLGAHARRSRFLFGEAIGNDVKIGIISVGDMRYESRNWWKSSSGVRETLGETIAYLYARFIFQP